jgi:RNA-binding protein YhbY
MPLTSKQTKQLLARARMQRARVHLGLDGIQPNVIEVRGHFVGVREA